MPDTGDGGPGGAQRKLIAQLREGMTARKMRQADLARRAGLSKASVSHIMSAKSVPTLDTLERLITAVGFPEQTAQDLYRLRERAEVRTHRLDAYLAAALGTARHHPYAGVLPGSAPSLTDVYLNQTFHRLGQDDRRSTIALRPAATVDVLSDDVLAGGKPCVVVAGPGGGKSSLLRMWLARGAERWLAGNGHETVPVLASAAALAGIPLAEALAAAANKGLEGLVEPLPPSFFSTPPQPSVRWLVLVDGLDEIADPRVRKGVLRHLAAVAKGEYADLYQFVVTTRPLADEEVDALGTSVARYELRPFAGDDLPLVAAGWFRHMQLPDSDRITQRFIQALKRTRLSELARVPLMTAMLCQLHAAAPDQPLPDSRSQTYRHFITLLQKQQYAAGSPYAHAALFAGLERYGTAALARAENVLDHLHDLIAYLAAQRHAGDTRPALDVLGCLPEVQTPTRVPEDDWQAFLHNALRRSGLLVAPAGDLVFLHQTLLEYLAARHIMRDRATGVRAVRRIFNRSDVYDPSVDLGGGLPGIQAVWGRRYWNKPTEDPSYVGFLLDAAHDNGFTLRPSPLRRLAARGGLSGCQYIVALHRLGTVLSGDVRNTTTRRLHDLVHDPTISRPSIRVRAAEALAELGDPRAMGLLRNLALDRKGLGSSRMSAAKVLADMNDPDIAHILRTLARDADVVEDFPNTSFRVKAAKALADFDRVQAADIMRDLILDTSLRRDHITHAAEELAALDRSRSIDALRALAGDTTYQTSSRLTAAETLAELHDAGASDHLHSLAVDAAIDASSRLQAAKALEGLGDPRVANLVHPLTFDTAGDAYSRVEAAVTLARLGDGRAASALKTLALDSTINDSSRMKAAAALISLDGPRAAAILQDLALDPTIRATSRVGAATALTGQGDTSAADLLDRLASDPVIGMQAAEALADLGDPRAADHFHDIALHTEIAHHSRTRAAERLSKLDDHRAADVFHALALEAALDASSRGRAADSLAKLGDARAADLLHTLALDTNFSFRIRPAKSLAKLGDPRAGGVFHTLALDAALDASSRIQAADSLAKLGDPRATDLLHTLALDGAIDASSRIQAADSLAKLGDARATDLLHTLALDTIRRREGATAKPVSKHFSFDEAAFDMEDHMEAVKRLAELGDPRAADHYHALALDSVIDDSFRTQAAEALDSIGDPRAPGILDALSSEPALDD
ncbi:helix-turn-helix domain-containing protein [Streptomyces sp. NPDC029041]|uniref:helix-turn-helix domain-containing protein n=1 Tax=Streptomyces sp. NPDC029041 TaxID=3155727 RepID=UPI0033C62EA8